MGRPFLICLQVLKICKGFSLYRCSYLFLSLNTFSQSVSAAAKNQPANSWLRTPTVSPLAQDFVAPVVRADRDAYFDEIIGSRTPLTGLKDSFSVLSEGSHLGQEEEIPKVPMRSVVIAQFQNFQSVLSSSHRSIYTEVTFKADRVLEDTARHIAGNTFTVIVPGGTVDLNGRTISYLTADREYYIQPGQKYLLVLSYNALGDFFTLAKTWVVLTGCFDQTPI